MRLENVLALKEELAAEQAEAEITAAAEGGVARAFRALDMSAALEASASKVPAVARSLAVMAATPSEPDVGPTVVEGY